MLIFTNFRYFRAVAYRWFVRWICGPMGLENSWPLSVCAYHRIRSKLPSGRSRGYTPAEERPWAWPWFNKCFLFIHKTLVFLTCCVWYIHVNILYTVKNSKIPSFIAIIVQIYIFIYLFSNFHLVKMSFLKKALDEGLMYRLEVPARSAPKYFEINNTARMKNFNMAPRLWDY